MEKQGHALAVLQVCVLLGMLATVMAGMRQPEECAGLTCSENRILKYNGTCHCELNPCHQRHCTDANYPVLDFEYDHKGGVNCFCTKPCPHNLCGGQRKPVECASKGFSCPSDEHPILMLEDGQCVCKSHPCQVARKARCDNPALPWNDYHYDSNGNLDCFCRQHPCPNFACNSTSSTPVVKWDQEGNCFCGAATTKEEL